MVRGNSLSDCFVDIFLMSSEVAHLTIAFPTYITAKSMPVVDARHVTL